MKYCLGLFTVCMGLSCSSGQTTGKDMDRKEAETAINDLTENTNITLEIVPQSYSGVPGQIHLLITNHTTSVLEYGAGYQVEKYDPEAEEWQHMDFFDHVAVISIMYMLPAGESGSYAISLFPDQVDYEAGRYRVKKQIYTGEESVELYAEFIIE
ncbi:MAG: hypothetical protein LIP08_11890 [Bacteroides sp.]|nr:hypothetical protein [Bacteroides sp.]